ncbi:MAG: site-2 protease family protein, partial [Gammaproteobacteria bacterium]|nr:site-2 protease family protein [Gammaproteobacteria bacterium]
EFSHSIVARHYGMPIKGITLFIFGGVAEMEEEPTSPRSEFLMAIAGPLASFLLSFVFSRIEATALLFGWPMPVVGVCNALAYVNLVVAVFNLVPAFPLDGGRMLRAALWYWRKDMHAATRISSQMGSGFGLALMVLGVITFLQGNIIGGMWWFLIGIFLRNVAAASYQRLVLHEMLHREPVSRFMRSEPVTVPPSITIREWVEDYVYRHHFKMFPVVDGGQLLGCVSIDNIRKVPRGEWDIRTVRDVMEPGTDANTVPAGMAAEKLLTAMVQPGRQARYMVVDGGKLVGVVSLKDVLELVALKMQIEPPQGDA